MKNGKPIRKVTLGLVLAGCFALSACGPEEVIDAVTTSGGEFIGSWLEENSEGWGESCADAWYEMQSGDYNSNDVADAEGYYYEFCE